MPMYQYWKYIQAGLFWGLASVLLLAALLLVGARFASPQLDQYRAEVQQQLGSLLGQPIAIGEIALQWHGWSPELRVFDVRLLGEPKADGARSAWLSFGSVAMRLALLESLRQRTIVSSGLSVAGLSLRAERYADGSFALRDVRAAAVEATGRVVDSARLLGWLTRQPRIELRDMALSLHDWRMSESIDIDDLSLTLANETERHRLTATLRVGKDPAATVRIVADISGNVTRPADWAGELFVSAAALPLAALLKTFTTALPADESAKLSFRAWSTWRGGALQQIVGAAAVQLKGAAEEDALPALSVNTDFRLHRAGAQWQLRCEPLSIGAAPPTRPPNRLLATIGWDSHGAVNVAGSLRYLRLGGLAATAATAATALRHVLTSIDGVNAIDAIDAIDGALEQVQFSWRTGGGDEAAFALRANVADLNLLSDKAALRRANGVLEISNDVALFAIDTAVLEVPSLPIQAGKLTLEDVQGTLIALKRSQGLRLTAPRLGFRYGALSVAATATLTWPRASASQPQKASPYLDARLRFGNARYPDVQGLIPSATYPPLKDWIASALPEVVAENAVVRLKGRFSDSIRTWAKNLEVDIEGRCASFPYYFGKTKDWPPLENMKGRITIRGNRIDVTSATARFAGLALRDLRFQVADMSAAKSWLHVSYAVAGDAQAIRQSVQATPFARAMSGAALENFKLDGPLDLRMQLKIPLVRGLKPIITGRASLQDNRLQLPGQREGLTALNGTVDFRHDGTTLQRFRGDIRALYLGQPLSLKVNLSPRYALGVRIATALTVDNDYLLRLGNNLIINEGLPISAAARQRYLRYLDGNSRWQVVLGVYQEAPTEALQATLSLDSELHGLALALPPPFGKTAVERRSARIVGQFTADGDLRLRIDYADRLRGTFALALGEHGMRDVSGHIHLGEGREALPLADAAPAAARGIAISGRLDVVDWQQWQELLLPLLSPPLSAAANAAGSTAADAAPTPASKPQPTPAVLQSLELAIGDLRYGNLSFNTTHLRVRPYRQPDQASGWAIEVRGDDLSASVSFTAGSEATRIKADVRHIRIGRSMFPNTRIKAERLPQSGWRITLAGEKLAGTLSISPDAEPASVAIDLEHLELTTADDAAETRTAASAAAIATDAAVVTESTVLPQDIPSFSASIRSLRLNDRDLGRLQFATRRRFGDQHNYTLAIDNDAFSLAASGAWKAADGIALSTLRGKLAARDAGALLARFDYDRQHLKGGVVEALFDLRWSGSPIDYELAKLNGNLNLEINDGLLLQVKRGLIARAFGLLAITALPQRLLLNFSDVFKQGLPYHVISGAFLLRGGNACLHYLALNSDLVDFSFTGRVDLRTKRFDGIATVKPRITNSLPLIPIRLFEVVIGAAIFDPLFTYRYAVSGDFGGEAQFKPLSAGPELSTVPQC